MSRPCFHCALRYWRNISTFLSGSLVECPYHSLKVGLEKPAAMNPPIPAINAPKMKSESTNSLVLPYSEPDFKIEAVKMIITIVIKAMIP